METGSTRVWWVGGSGDEAATNEDCHAAVRGIASDQPGGLGVSVCTAAPATEVAIFG